VFVDGQGDTEGTQSVAFSAFGTCELIHGLRTSSSCGPQGEQLLRQHCCCCCCSMTCLDCWCCWKGAIWSSIMEYGVILGMNPHE